MIAAAGKTLKILTFLTCISASAGEPTGHKLLLTSVRTGDTEVFVVDPQTGDAQNVSRSPSSEDRYPCWSPDGQWISFRLTDERYWSNKERMLKTYSEKPADKRPVWLVRSDGTEAHVIECLRFQCAIDGSRASWRPLK